MYIKGFELESMRQAVAILTAIPFEMLSERPTDGDPLLDDMDTRLEVAKLKKELRCKRSTVKLFAGLIQALTTEQELAGLLAGDMSNCLVYAETVGDKENEELVDFHPMDWLVPVDVWAGVEVDMGIGVEFEVEAGVEIDVEVGVGG